MGPCKAPAWSPTAASRPHKLFLVSDVACRVLNFSVYLQHVSAAASGGRDQEGVAFAEELSLRCGGGRLSDKGVAVGGLGGL